MTYEEMIAAGLTPAEAKELATLETAEKTVVVSGLSGKAQGQRALELFAQSRTVTTAQLAAINPKYPSDPIYYARKEFGAVIDTQKARGGKTTYTLRMSPADVRRKAELLAKVASKPAAQTSVAPKQGK